MTLGETEKEKAAAAAAASKATDVAVGLERRQDDIRQPQAEEQAGSGRLGQWRSAEFSADVGSAPIHEDGDADEGEDGEEGDGESQRSRVHPEHLVSGVVVNGGDGPGHADAQEHVDGITSRHVADGGVGILVLGGRHLAGEGIWRKRRDSVRAPRLGPRSTTAATTAYLARTFPTPQTPRP